MRFNQKLALIAGISVLLGARASFADVVIDFNFVNGSWSWFGSGTVLSADSAEVTVGLVGSGNPRFPLGTITFTTGAALSGTDPDPFVFDPEDPTKGQGSATFARGGHIVVSDGCTGMFMAFTNVCYHGDFTAGASAAISPLGDSLTLSAFRMKGKVDPALLLELGLDPTTTDTIKGTLSALLLSDDNITFSGGGAGKLDVGSGDLTVRPIPEPATLALLGTGLVGIARMLRRKRRS